MRKTALFKMISLTTLAFALAACTQPQSSTEEEPPPDEAEEGERHAGEEGKMGKPNSKSKSGLYAMKGPKDAIPQAEADDEDVWGGLTGSEIGEAHGVGGLGLVGTGRGGGGTGSGYGRGTGAPVMMEPLPTTDDEDYAKVDENQMTAVSDEPLSTFSIDVDTASYSNMRRFVQGGSLPQPDAVRVEEFINYFSYDYADPNGDQPFSIAAEVANAPWAEGHRLVHVGIKGKSIPFEDVPARNLVFLLDVSGSMNNHDKLPLLKTGLAMVVRDLRPQDRVSIVVYAGSSGLVLPPTSGKNSAKIMASLDKLQAGGSTNGGEGINLAYKIAQENFVKGGINRVLLATDGDFNVGTSSQAELERLIEKKRESGVFLTVLGFGSGNLKDSTMEMLADKGNGNYAYIDSAREANKVLVKEAGGTLVTIAKDVKIQVEFNPRLVSKYRLIGYENRRLAAKDFNDDKKDAGEIGAGHTVTALYELEMADGAPAPGKVDALKYQQEGELSKAAAGSELMNVKVRYKQPEGGKSTLITSAVSDADTTWKKTSDDYRFSAAVAMYAMVLRDSKYKGTSSYELASSLGASALGKDKDGYRAEFLDILRRVEKGNLEVAQSVGGSGIGFGGRGRRVPRVRQAKAKVEGPLDRDIIRRIVRAHINEIRSCYNQGLVRDPNLQGRAIIRFEISGAGKVASANYMAKEGSLKDAKVGQCMAKAVKRWKFPRPREGKSVNVTYPFTLSPG